MKAFRSTVVVAVLAATSIIMPTAGASPRTWVYARDFLMSPNQANPSPDAYGNVGVWNYLESTTLVRDPSTYHPMMHALHVASPFGGTFEGWESVNTVAGTPVAWTTTSGYPPYNVVAGEAMVHPGPDRLVVLGWRSPIRADVSIAGGVVDKDAGGGDGIRWFISNGSTELASGGFGNGGSQSFADGAGAPSLSRVSVEVGDFLYLVVHPGGGFDYDTTGVDLRITELNRAPIANGQAVAVTEDTATPITLSAVDANSDTLSYSVVSGPAHGTLTGAAPALTYTPDPDYNGPDTFTFDAADGDLTSDVATVSIDVTPVNDAPVAADDTVFTPQYTPVIEDVTANDTDADGDPLVVVSVTQPTHGQASIEPDGRVRYAPDPSFKGTDAFMYSVGDGFGGSASGSVRVSELACGEDGIRQLSDTPAQGAASETVDRQIEPTVAQLSPDTARAVHDANCSVVVPAEGIVENAGG